jgi:hypothetical protein
MSKKKRKKLQKKKNQHVTLSIFFVSLIIGGGLWFVSPLLTTTAEVTEGVATTTQEELSGKHVVIHLNTMSLELHDGTTTTATLPILSQGKPGSYYETIGGSYVSDYKVPLHFSSIGHVYMPYSIHLFGNYFIHGVPYYPGGEKVSSAYSGGCIRLSDADARTVYDFVEPGTPIIVTRDSEYSFSTTTETGTPLSSQDMTNSMVATISLEALTQDNPIVGTDGVTTTTRKALLPRLINYGDISVSHLYATSIGEDAFVSLMNEKALAIGLSNTHFTDVSTAASTTQEDYNRFMNYLSTYKSYLRTLRLPPGGPAYQEIISTPL